MNILHIRQCLGLISLFLALASCGPIPQAGGGIGGTGSITTVSSGPVTKFGSVFVSGTEYDNSRAIYCFDDACDSENKLKLGMIVLVNGTITEQYDTHATLTRIAETITYRETVEGTVQSVAADGLSLTILGQVIHLNQKTIIDTSIPGQSIVNLIAGSDHIEVSGFVVEDGHILATLIMRHTGLPHHEVQGTIKNHDAQAHTFEIGALRINYANAEISQMPSSTWDKLVVHIRGEQWNDGGGTPSGGILTATHITLLDFGPETHEEAELEGFILQVNEPGNFVINNLPIQTSPATVFEGGAVSDLTLNTHVIVHGRLSDGTLIAEHVSFEGEFELESNVIAIDYSTRSLMLAGLPGMTVLIDNHTAIDGENDLHTFDGIALGNHLKIHARTSGGSLLATELERSESSARVSIQGPVQSVSNSILAIAGATIDTSGIPNDRFIGSDGTVIGRSSFFESLATSHNISLQGTWTGSTVTWTSARLRTQDRDS